MEKISFNLVMMFMNILTAAVQGGEHPQLECCHYSRDTGL